MRLERKQSKKEQQVPKKPSRKKVKDFIRESNLIENINNPIEDEQSLYAWDWLMEQDELSHGVICKTQKIITLHQHDLRPNQKGYYRSLSKVNVMIGGNMSPDYGMVDGLMDNWLLDYKKLSPKTAHIRFEKIHPFVDGNGRTGRMLYNWYRLKNGDDIHVILNKEKTYDYYRWFQ